MNNFIDTNLALGYSLSCDKWHVQSKKFILENNNLYWSNNVSKEFQAKYNNLFNSISSFLSKISVVLNLNEKSFINYDSFERFIMKNTAECELDKTKKIKIIEFFWENNQIMYNDSPMELIYKFNLFLINYIATQDNRKKAIETNINLHNCGLNNFKKYLTLQKQLENMGVHNPDYKIVLDAHDLGLLLEVSFNTTDKELYEKIIKSAFLHIKKYNLIN